MVTQIIGTSTPQQTHFLPKKTSAAFRLGPIQRKDLSEPVKELSFGPWLHGGLVAASNGQRRPSIFALVTAPLGC